MEPLAPARLKRGRIGPMVSRSEAAASIVLIDARPIIRQCFSHWLEENARDGRVIAFATAADACDDPRAAREAHLVVCSIGGARVTDPEVLDNIRQLAQALPNVPVVLLSDHDDVEEVAKAIRHGVRGYVPTNLDLSELAAAIHCVEAGGTFVPADTLIRFVLHQCSTSGAVLDVERPLSEGLTPREMEVVARLRQGKPNKVIAYELEISESTVKAFVRRILIKLHALNRTEVVHLTEGLFADIQNAFEPRRSRQVAGERI
ncbi:MAG TPA: response regulator transcription factor [Geminicoccaceae bacterium]|nr:response regulator transcription factor [Geminicoccaceae bacterium]